MRRADPSKLMMLTEGEMRLPIFEETFGRGHCWSIHLSVRGVVPRKRRLWPSVGIFFSRTLALIPAEMVCW